MTNLRTIRKGKGLTLTKVGELLGKEQATVSRYESPKFEHQLTLPLLRQFADLYGCTIAELIGEAPPVQRGTLDHAAMLAAVEAVETFFAEVAPRILSKDELTYFRTPPVKARIMILLYEKVVSGKMQTDQLPELIETARMLRVGGNNPFRSTISRPTLPPNHKNRGSYATARPRPPDALPAARFCRDPQTGGQSSISRTAILHPSAAGCERGLRGTAPPVSIRINLTDYDPADDYSGWIRLFHPTTPQPLLSVGFLPLEVLKLPLEVLKLPMEVLKLPHHRVYVHP